MSLVEVQFPTDISYGSRGGPGYNTSVIETDSGQEERIARWTNARRQYDVAYGVKSPQQMADLQTFFHSRQGAAFGFRYKDFLDFTTAIDHIAAHKSTDVQIGVGDGSTTQFQLVKKYTNGGVTRTRNITKPVAGTTLCALDGVDQAPSAFTVNTVTGIVTYTVAPGVDVAVQGGCEFDVPVRFSDETDKLLDMSIDDFSNRSASIFLVELLDESFLFDEFHFGGAGDLSISADKEINLSDGRVLRMTSGATPNLEVILPIITDLPTGGPYFYIRNIGTNFLRIVTTQGITAGQEIDNLQQDETIIILLSLNGSTKEWIGIKV